MVLVLAIGWGLLVLGAMSALHLGLLAAASCLFRSPRPPAEIEDVRFLIVIPAHNEEVVLAETLDAIGRSRRARDQVLVIDDRSHDRTGEIARAWGAMVLRRSPGEEPGRAAARQAGIACAADMDWDAMVMIDADSIVEPDFFQRCEEALAHGADALQARSEAIVGRRLVDQVALASFAMQGVVLPRGREVLSLPVRLRGTGMVLRRRLVFTLNFDARASEDLQVSLDLVAQGVRIRHADAARLRSANADNWGIATTQKQRYEAGRMSAARRFVPQLLRQHRVGSFEAAWFIASPPFAVAVGLTAIAAVIGFVADGRVLLGSALGACGLLAFAFAVAVFEGRIGPRILGAIAIAPAYVAWKMVVQLRALIGLRGGVREFGATTRVAPAERGDE